MAAPLCRPAMRAARLLSATAPLRTASTAATAPSKPASAPAAPPIASTNPLESSYSDLSTLSELDASGTDWTRSFAGLSSSPFSKEAANVLLAPLDPLDVEIKPDGIVYLPEIKYRRILNRAFGPGGWGLAPRGPASVAGKAVSREYALVCLGRLVSVARGEQTFFDPSGVATAAEGAKSNALMRCCKDLGVASELWDPRFIREFKRKHAVDVWVKSAKTNEKKKMWRLKDSPPISQYPWTE